ncbi:hypothetical protein NSZ01_29370 [Nocardioides szechwanensis]|uniref:DUF5666 domain-containing protein n=1 Tax=Nocardioides szechwanensis TaxID=1005944 RepID=A0A1H0DJZ3_9ACTN|nr:hypothetical protein [Nocardioides szechwanensis]GEP35169.1 hypothetical protein NSZ01_29370 [Nocardioides szechwanensis]SDN70490.1 hypothetical protein SAMN05192576_2594 [Nocardioides szechwanensis]
MTLHDPLPGRTVAVGAALAAAGLFGVMPLAHAGSSDADGDGIPHRWERSHGMNPFKAADARADFDLDRLSNLREYRLGSRIRDEDSDNDGHDDGDEVRDGFGSTALNDRDTDDDGDSDGDGESDEDEADVLGTIDSFDGTTLVVTSVNGFIVSGMVTEDTKVELEEDGEDGEGAGATTADLQPGVTVAEIEFDDETGAIEEAEIYLTSP